MPDIKILEELLISNNHLSENIGHSSLTDARLIIKVPALRVT